MNGRLMLRAGVREGRTVLLESMGGYPLQVLRPHTAPCGGGVSLVLLLQSGGLLDGDELAIDVVVEPGARLALRSQAATQAHVGRSLCELRASVGAGAWFSYVPYALVPHAGADYHAQTCVRMQPDSRVLLADALAPGRVQHGEQFAYTQVQMDLDVWCAGDLVARERALIRPDARVRAAQLGSFTHTAAVYVLGASHPPVIEADGCTRIGRTQLAHGGWYVRALANTMAALDQALTRLHRQWWCGTEIQAN